MCVSCQVTAYSQFIADCVRVSLTAVIKDHMSADQKAMGFREFMATNYEYMYMFSSGSDSETLFRNWVDNGITSQGSDNFCPWMRDSEAGPGRLASFLKHQRKVRAPLPDIN